MSIVGSGNCYNHPTKKERIKHIEEMATKLKNNDLRNIDLMLVKMADLYEIEIRLESRLISP